MFKEIKSDTEEINVYNDTLTTQNDIRLNSYHFERTSNRVKETKNITIKEIEDETIRKKIIIIFYILFNNIQNIIENDITIYDISMLTIIKYYKSLLYRYYDKVTIDKYIYSDTRNMFKTIKIILKNLLDTENTDKFIELLKSIILVIDKDAKHFSIVLSSKGLSFRVLYTYISGYSNEVKAAMIYQILDSESNFYYIKNYNIIDDIIILMEKLLMLRDKDILDIIMISNQILEYFTNKNFSIEVDIEKKIEEQEKQEKEKQELEKQELEKQELEKQEKIRKTDTDKLEVPDENPTD